MTVNPRSNVKVNDGLQQEKEESKLAMEGFSRYCCITLDDYKPFTCPIPLLLGKSERRHR